MPRASDLTVETMEKQNPRAALSQAVWAGVQALPGLADDLGKRLPFLCLSKITITGIPQICCED